jgi:predicted DCC family thiol-disulfide oxidoreductase YuxK
MKTAVMQQKHTVVFDGGCNLCAGTVRFIARRDPRAVFVFVPMQSAEGKALIAEHRVAETDCDTLLLIKNGRVHVRSDAALEITRDLSGAWFLFRIFLVLPRCARDYFYNLVARNRYRWFGRSCTPNPGDRSSSG